MLFNENPTYIFTTKYSLIYNHIAIIFSPNEFYKANDQQGENEKYTLPRELTIDKYQEADDIDRIYATIYCEQKSQKGILIGKGGSLLKKIGTDARLELEKIVDKKVFLSLEVKVEKDWRKKENLLKNFGYVSENN